MNRLLIKLEFFFYFFKSKALKKKIFNIEKKNSLNFKKIISKYRFENFWFLNNIEIINIPNVPLKKWFHLVIRCENKYLDVYINGLVVTRRNLMNVPLQNYDDIRICDSGGFNGNLSNLIYYSYSLNAIDINSLALAGPNTKNLDTTPDNSYGSSYLSTMWYAQ